MMMSLSKQFTHHGAAQMITPSLSRALFVRSLTMTYFHMGIHTIIGAKSFHCPVRDGKEWDQLAMVIRLKLSLTWFP